METENSKKNETEKNEKESLSIRTLTARLAFLKRTKPETFRHLAGLIRQI